MFRKEIGVALTSCGLRIGKVWRRDIVLEKELGIWRGFRDLKTYKKTRVKSRTFTYFP
jgi:hypothetical protein